MLERQTVQLFVISALAALCISEGNNTNCTLTPSLTSSATKSSQSITVSSSFPSASLSQSTVESCTNSRTTTSTRSRSRSKQTPTHSATPTISRTAPIPIFSQDGFSFSGESIAAEALWTPRNAVARTRWLQGFESSGIIFDATLGMHWLLPGKPRSDTGLLGLGVTGRIGILRLHPNDVQ